MIAIPENFKESIISLLGEEEGKRLIDALNSPPVTSIRLNVRKPGAEFTEMQQVPWCKSGYYLASRPEFILDPLLHAGAYYVQDASSMIYETVTERLLSYFAKQSSGMDFNLKVLDLCAAPGGKTTAMINALPDGSIITANEYTPRRVGALRENLERWAYPDVTITNKDSRFYAMQGENYDIVAVDAPCSGEGMMRKEEMARSQWSPALVQQCAVLQKEILRNAVEALKPGGYLIYSTCTFNRTENEENAEFLSQELKLEPVDMQFPSEWGIRGGVTTNLPVYRFMPHITQGEGLFLAVFRKPGDWIPFKSRHNKKKEEEINYPKVDVDKSTAIAYLRRESIKLPEDSPRGLVTITYKGLPLGQVKNIGSRANNLLPKNRRILKQ